MNDLEAYECGTDIKTIIGGIEAKITCVSVRFTAIQYEVSYFVGGIYTTCWLNEKEFKTEAEKIKIGFKT